MNQISIFCYLFKKIKNDNRKTLFDISFGQNQSIYG